MLYQYEIIIKRVIGFFIIFFQHIWLAGFGASLAVAVCVSGAGAQCSLALISEIERQEVSNSLSIEALNAYAIGEDRVFLEVAGRDSAQRYLFQTVTVGLLPGLPILGRSGTYSDPIFSTVGTLGGPNIAIDEYFIGVRFGNLVVLDMHEPESPEETGSLDLPGTISALGLAGQTILATSSGRIDALRFGQQGVPVVTDTLEVLGGGSRAFGVSNSGLLPFRDAIGTKLLDVSNPNELRVLGSVDYQTGGEPALVGYTLVLNYVSSGSTRLILLDVGNPDDPVLLQDNYVLPDIGELIVGGVGTCATYFGVGTGRTGAVVALDLEDPAMPVLADTYIAGTQNFGKSVRLLGNQLIVVSVSGIKVFDIQSCLGCQCLPDFTGDGDLNFFDVSAFLVAYQSQDPTADFNGDGLFNFFDVSEFLVAFNAGCP